MGYTLIYKTKEFISLMKKERLADSDLIRACKEMSQGLYDADLGGGLYKKRIASLSKGKQGGYRTIVGANVGDKYFFLYAFAKSSRANINSKEKLALKELARLFLAFSTIQLNQLVESGELFKVEITNE